MVVQLSIDLTKVDKSKIKEFTRKDGSKGLGYDLVVFLKDETDQYGNDGFVAESVPKDSPEKGAILGNARIAGKQRQQSAADQPQVQAEPVNDLPF